MPRYTLENAMTGGKITVEMAQPPTDDEVDEIFASIPAPQASAMPETTPLAQPAPTPAPDTIVNQVAGQWAKPLPTRSPLEADYWTENVPQSIARLPAQLVSGGVGMVYNAAKKFTDPFANALAGGDLGQAASDLFNAPKNAAGEFLEGTREFIGGPMGLAKDRTLKEAWSDPAASLTALAPFAKGAGGAIAKAAPKPVGLVEKSLRFAPDTDPKLQARVAETVYNEGAVTTKASYNEFVKKIEDRAKEVWELIGPVAKQEVMPDVAKAQEAARTWAGTSTDMGKNIKKIDGYFERFLDDHPTLTVEEAQKIKVNLNKDLTNYYKAVAKGDKVKVDPTIEAKKELMYVLRDVVDQAAPGTGEINANISDLMTAKPFLKNAMNKVETRPLLDAPTYHAGVLGGMAGTLLGDYSTGGGAGMMAMGASRLLTDQRVQSGAAQGMRYIGEIPGQVQNLLANAPNILNNEKGSITLPGIKKATENISDSTKFFSKETLSDLNAPPAFKSRSVTRMIPIDFFLEVAEKGTDSIKTKRVQELVDKGEKFSDIPTLGIGKEGKVISHEGRHRARQLRKMGYTEMPVEIRSENIRWSEQNRPGSFDYIQDWPIELVSQDGKKTMAFPFDRSGNFILTTNPLGQ